MKRRKSKFKQGCGWIDVVCSTFFFIGLTALILLNYSCAPEIVIDPRPSGNQDMITPLGINVWTNEHNVDPDEIDDIIEEVVEEQGYGPVPAFDLVIEPAHCREYPDGLTYCGFECPDLPYMLAGRFYYHELIAIKIHLMNGEWTLEQSALKHEIRHYVMYIHRIPGWDINSDKSANEGELT